MKPKARHLSIARFGWTLWFPGHEEHGIRYLYSKLQGYRDTWRDHLHEMADDIVGTDATTVPDDEIVTWAWRSPMCKPDLPDGMVLPVGGPLRPWKDEPREGTEPRLGNVCGLDYVALDVYVMLLRRFGGRTFDPRDERVSIGSH